MSIKKIFALLCSIAVFWSIPVFADCGNTERQYIEKQVDIRNETLTFTTIIQKHEIGYRCYPGLSIMIKESRTGILKDGDVIYFKTGTAKNDNKYLKVMDIDITAKGVTAKEIKLPEENENCFAIRISRENKNSFAQIAQIDMQFLGDFYGVSYEDEYTPTFSLYLDADKTKENNLFSGEQDILLNERFLTITGGVAEREQRDNEVQQKLKEGLPGMIFSPDSHTAILGTEKISLKHSVYINEKGTAMLSLEDFEFIMNQLNDIGASVRHHVFNDGKENIYSVTAGKNDYMIQYEKNIIDFAYNNENIKNVLEEKNGVGYIPLRVIAKMLDMENYIYWDNNTKIITISK